ncbi:hypothetical protein OK016_16280 [Vibrio chagasii]|nr:hypothetical protein [Vibrio chagasii]
MNTYYAQTGLADLYVGKNNIPGNNSALVIDDQYQDDIYNQGRLAMLVRVNLVTSFA